MLERGEERMELEMGKKYCLREKGEYAEEEKENADVELVEMKWGRHSVFTRKGKRKGSG